MTFPPSNLVRLFETEEGPLLHFAIGLVRRKSVGEEIVQEAFLRLHQVRTQVENPRAWLYRCVRNLALNHLRDHRYESALEEGADPAGEGQLPDEEAARREAVGIIRMLLAELAPADRDLIRLKYSEGLKYDEIGRRTGLNAGHVGYKLHHLLKGLADSLRRAGVEGSEG